MISAIRPAFGNVYYRVFPTADGFVAVGCLSTPLRRRLLAAIDMQDWRVGKAPQEIDYSDPEVLEYCKQLIADVEAIFVGRTTDDWLRILDGAGVPAGPLKFTEELLDDAQVLENNFVTSVEHSLMGPVRMAGPMIQMSQTPLAPQGASPTLGQHTDDVLRELGYDDERIAALREAGVLGTPPG